MFSTSRLARFTAALMVAICATVSLVPSAGAAQFRSEYAYPYQNPLFATVTVRLLKPATDPVLFTMPGLPGRDRVPLVEGRERLDISYFPQSKRAPLIFVIPGFGGSATDGSALFLGEMYQKAGFHAVVLASPMFWKFVLSQSSSAVPGFTPEDAKDLRRLMIQTKARIEREYGAKIGRVAVAGYSLGAVDSAFIMKLEREEPRLGLERAVMINPPLDITHALETLDRMNAVGDRWTADARSWLWGSVINAGSAALARDVRNPMYFYGLDHVLSLTDGQLKYLIGNSFRQTLADTIFLSQQVRDIGLLKRSVKWGARQPRQAEAASLSFGDYMKRGAWPFWSRHAGAQWSIEDFVSQGNLLSLRELLVNDPAFRLFHNSDDFLTRADDLKALGEQMGDRAVIYPYGGHVGNLWMPANQSDLIEAVRDLKD